MGMSNMNEENLRNLFSKNIKRYRQMKGWSQEKLAEKMDISTNYLSEIETGRGWVSPFSLVKLANALETDVFELFKPHEAVTATTIKIINKCLDDFSTALRISFDKSLNDSMQKIKKNL
jgi:transcriptional regulator with XRE-family HTH domain